MIRLVGNPTYQTVDGNITGTLTNLEGNLFKKINFTTQFEVETFVKATDNLTIEVGDATYQSADYITLQTNDFSQFNEDETVEVLALTDSGGNLLLPAGDYIIDVKVNDSTVRFTDDAGNPLVEVTGTPVYGEVRRGFANTGTIRLMQEPGAFRFKYGLIENEEALNYRSKVDFQDLFYDLNNVPTGAEAFVEKFKSSARAHEVGDVTIEKIDDDTLGIGRWTYEIVQEFYIHPFYNINQIGVLQDITLAPTYLDLSNSLRHVFAIEVFKNNTADQDSQEYVITDVDRYVGNVGFRNENYNGLSPKYSLQSVSYNNNIGQLQKETVTTVTVEIAEANLAAGFIELSFILLPETSDQYENINSPMFTNFMFDQAVITVGGGTVNGFKFGGDEQVITNASAITAAGVTTLTFDVDFGADAVARIEELDSQNYWILANTFAAGQTYGTADETLVQVDYNNIGIEIPSGTLDVTTFYIRDDINVIDDTKGFESPTLFKNSENVASSRIILDKTDFPELRLDSVEGQIIASNGIDEIVLDSQLFDLSGNQLIDGNTVADESVTTGFNVLGTEIRSKYRLYRDTTLDSGNEVGYRLVYPFLLRWEYWRQLILETLPADLADPNLPFNGYNQDWYRIDTLANWELYFRVKVKGSIDEGNVSFEEQDSQFATLDYNSNPNWINENITLYDENDNLLVDPNSSLPYIKKGERVKIVAEFENINPVFALDYFGWLQIGAKENHTWKSIDTLSTEFDRSGISTLYNPFNDGKAEISQPSPSVLQVIGYVNPDKFQGNFNDYTIFSKIDVGGIPPIPFTFVIDTSLEDGSGTGNTSYQIPTSVFGDYDNVIAISTSDGQLITGNFSSELDPKWLLNFAAPGQYVVKIFSNGNWSGFENEFSTRNLDRIKLTDLTRFGNGFILNEYFNLNGCVNVTSITAADLPVITQLIGVNGGQGGQGNGWFRLMRNLTSVNRINEWDTSNVDSIQSMFQRFDDLGVTPFQDVFNDWDMTNVVAASAAFRNVRYTQDIQWVLSSCVTSTQMFQDSDFNGNIGTFSFDSLEASNEMFNQASLFNNGGSDSIRNWNLSNLVTATNTFRLATSFNQPVDGWGLESLEIGNGMFLGASAFNQDVGNWVLGSLISMQGMFLNAINFNNGGTDNINNLDVSTVENFRQVFQGATSFNQPLDQWDFSSATNMDAFLNNATAYDKTNASDLIIRIFNTHTVSGVLLGGTGVEITKGIVVSGTNTATGNTITDAGATFITDGVQVGWLVLNTTTGAFAQVTVVVSETELTLDASIMNNGDTYEVYENVAEFSRAALVADGWIISGFTPTP